MFNKMVIPVSGGRETTYEDSKTVSGSTVVFDLPFIPTNASLYVIDSSTHFVVQIWSKLGEADQTRAYFYTSGGYAECGTGINTTQLVLNGQTLTWNITSSWGISGKTVKIIANK